MSPGGGNNAMGHEFCIIWNLRKARNITWITLVRLTKLYYCTCAYNPDENCNNNYSIICK